VTPSDPNFITAPPNYPRIAYNFVPSYTMFSLNAAYDWENVGSVKKFTLWASINNLFDKEPPLAVAQNSGANGGTNPVFFDTVGRYYKGGVRMSF